MMTYLPNLDLMSIFTQNILIFMMRYLRLIISIFVLSPYAYVQTDCTQAPDLIYYNGQVLTMNSAMDVFSAIAIHSDTIVQVGSDQDVLSLFVKSCTKKINLNGLTVIPGFNDSHCHWFSWREHICDIPAVNYTTYPELDEIMTRISRNGWTSISELNFGHPEFIPDHINNALDLEARGALKVRLNGYWGTYSDPEFLSSLKNMGIQPGHQYSKRIRVPGVKIYIDGPFGTMDILTPEQTNNLVLDAHADGWAVAAHCVNESAMEMIINALELALGDEDNTAYRHRIEHAVKINDDQLARIKQKEIIASFQLMGPPDWPQQETFMTYISNKNPQFALRWKDFFDQDIRSTGSTDAPFNNSPCDYSPFRVIYQAMTRMGYLNREHADWERAQRITLEQALKSLTIDGAYATGEDDIKGSLSPGKYADLVILSDNPMDFADQPDDLLDIDVLLTMVGGSVEYCSDLTCSPICQTQNSFELDSSIITVSNYLNDYRPEQAFDQNLETFWGSGDFPPQWIQVDLLQNKPIRSIELIISQWPEGKTVHQLLGAEDNNPCELILLQEFSGDTKDGDVLRYTIENEPDELRYIRVLTKESPSFVSWYEINVQLEDGTLSSHKLNNPGDALSIYPSPATDQYRIQYESNQRGPVEIQLLNIQGQTIAPLFKGNLEIGLNNWEFKVHEGIPNGLYLISLDTQNVQWIGKISFER